MFRLSYCVRHSESEWRSVSTTAQVRKILLRWVSDHSLSLFAPWRSVTEHEEGSSGALVPGAHLSPQLQLMGPERAGLKKNLSIQHRQDGDVRSSAPAVLVRRSIPFHPPANAEVAPQPANGVISTMTGISRIRSFFLFVSPSQNQAERLQLNHKAFSLFSPWAIRLFFPAFTNPRIWKIKLSTKPN